MLGKGRSNKVAPEHYDDSVEHQVYRHMLKHYIPEKGREARFILQDKDAWRELFKDQASMISAKASPKLVKDLAQSFERHRNRRDEDFSPHPIG